jgi:hypothetical protein
MQNDLGANRLDLDFLEVKMHRDKKALKIFVATRIGCGAGKQLMKSQKAPP